LEEQAAVRFLMGAIDCLLGGWDHRQTTEVLRLAPRFARSNAMDAFEFAIREQAPNAGLAALRALLPPDSGELTALLDGLAGMEAWLELRLTPQAWVSRLRSL